MNWVSTPQKLMVFIMSFVIIWLHIIIKDIINTINFWGVLTQFIHGGLREQIMILEIHRARRGAITQVIDQAAGSSRSGKRSSGKRKAGVKTNSNRPKAITTSTFETF